MNEPDFAQLEPQDLLWVIRRLPSLVRNELKARPGALVVAGGFVRSVIANETVNDVDLFVPAVEVGKSVASVLSEGHEKRVFKSDNALTVFGQKYPVQIITRWTYLSPEQIVPSFDFTIARAAVWWDGSKWQSLIAPTFYADLAARRLTYCSPDRNEDAGGSLLRVLKFYQRGYRIPLPSLGAVISRLLAGVEAINWEKRSTMEAKQWNDLMGHVLTGLLREVDPQLDPDHIAHLPGLPSEEPRPSEP